MNIPGEESAIVFYVDDNPDDGALFAVAAKQSTSFKVGTASGVSEAMEYLSGDKQYRDRTEYPVPDLTQAEAKEKRQIRFIRKPRPSTRPPNKTQVTQNTFSRIYASGRVLPIRVA